MSAQILSLARISQDAAKSGQMADDPDTEQFQDGEDRRLAPSRGIAMGVLVSLPLWLLIAAVFYFVL